MLDYIKLILIGVVAVGAAYMANYARDLAFQIHMILFVISAVIYFIVTMRGIDKPQPDPNTYMDGVVRAGVIATALWGVVGFLAGVFIASELAFPWLNFEWAQGYMNFGRLRPLHTSAVIFAFGGNGLIAT